jgi:hypothetical protein
MMDYIEYLKAEGLELPPAVEEHYAAYARAEVELVNHLQQIVALCADEEPTPLQMLIVQSIVALSKRENAAGSLQRAWVLEVVKPLEARIASRDKPPGPN